MGLDYVDLILLHGPSHAGKGSCDVASCAKDAGQWAAYSKLYKAGKAKAIGVSNYCVSCFDCLLKDPATVVPAVNQVRDLHLSQSDIATFSAGALLTDLCLRLLVDQIEFHVGMGADPAGIVSYCEKHNVRSIKQAFKGPIC